MQKKKVSVTYRVLKWFVWLFSPKMKVQGAENIPDEPVIIVGNHCQMYGPIACELYSPVPRRTWCAGQMMEWKEVPGYAYEDFWSGKPAHSRWFYKLLAHLITPVSVCLFNNAETIPVWRDSRILSTFRSTVNSLQQGVSVVIFPEHDVLRNNIIYDFQDRFIDVARLYYKKTGRAAAFVPLYIAPKLSVMVYGAPVRFDPDAPIEQERRRICEHLMEEITALGRGLPRHTVVPYRNIAKKDYPCNIL